MNETQETQEGAASSAAPSDAKPLPPMPAQAAGKPVYFQPEPMPMTRKDRNLRLAALILVVMSLLGTVVNGAAVMVEVYLATPSEAASEAYVLGISVLMMLLFAYRTFLAIRVNEIYKGIHPNSTGFAILVLLTGELFSGVALLLSKKDK